MGTHPAPAAPDLSFRVKPVSCTRVAVSSSCTSDQSNGSSRQTNVYLRRDFCSRSLCFPTAAIRTGGVFWSGLELKPGELCTLRFESRKPF
jgi:hypothetical protein